MREPVRTSNAKKPSTAREAKRPPMSKLIEAITPPSEEMGDPSPPPKRRGRPPGTRKDHPPDEPVLKPSKKTKHEMEMLNDDSVTNGAETLIDIMQPYTVNFELTGTADLLFHRWDCDAVDAKSKAAKNSSQKTTDDVESYVYRNKDGYICLPGEYVLGALILAARFKQDPRSPRKSASDLFRAGIISNTKLASLGAKKWDFLDRRRVTVQRAGINRTRPAFLEGWVAAFTMTVALPEYINAALLHDVLVLAGRIGGVGDFRPTHGRFRVTRFEVE